MSGRLTITVHDGFHVEVEEAGDLPVTHAVLEAISEELINWWYVSDDNCPCFDCEHEREQEPVKLDLSCPF